MGKSYALAVSASCGVALGLNSIVPRLTRVKPMTRVALSRLIPFAAVVSAGIVNVFLMRGEEIRQGIDVFPARTKEETEQGKQTESLGKSRKAATIAVAETALSRVTNATPIMVIPPLILLRMQKREWLKARPKLVLPCNLGTWRCSPTWFTLGQKLTQDIGLILATSYLALPFALGIFPPRESVYASTLEAEFHGRGGNDGMVEFNRGM